MTTRIRRARLRRSAVLAVPVTVPLSMTLVFRLLQRRMSPRAAYNVGFGVYWLGWCTGFPLWILGPRRARAVLLAHRGQLTVAQRTLLGLPVLGGFTTQLVPLRRHVDPSVAAVMIGTAIVNATGEELLWRGLFAEEFPDELARGALWPLAGFALWHLAPQQILPSAVGRWRFVGGAALVGAVATVAVRRTRGLRPVLLPHMVTDACGVTAARFRLGRLEP